MQQVQCNRYNATGTMQQVQCNRYNATGTMQQVQCNRYNATGTMQQVQCSRYNATGTMQQVQCNRYNATSLVHHESDQLCIFRPSLAAREQAICEGARLYYFSGSDALGNGGHSCGHFVESEELFQLTPGDYVHKDLTRKICGLT